MQNIIFASPKFSDNAVISASSELAEAPVTNIQLKQPKDLWVTQDGDVSGVTISIDLGSALTWDLIALLHTNIDSGSATWSVSAGAYSSGALTFWGADDLTDWNRKHGMLFLSSPQTEQNITITLNNAGNGDNRLEVGRLFIAKVYQPTINFSYGSNIWGMDDPSPKTRTIAGSRITRQMDPEFGPDLKLTFTDESEMRGNFIELVRQRGTAGDVLVVLDPEETQYRHQKIFHSELAAKMDLNAVRYSIFTISVGLLTLS